MAGMVSPVLTLTPDRATKTVRAVATCRINFTDFELTAMQQGAHFRLRAKLFGVDPKGARDLFTFTPHKIYPDATPTMSFVKGAPTFAAEVRSEGDYGPSAEDAWGRILRFFDEHLTGKPA